MLVLLRCFGAQEQKRALLPYKTEVQTCLLDSSHMVRQSRCAEHWSCQPSRTFPVLGMQNQEEWSLQVRRDRTAGALGCNNLLAEFGHSAKFSACAMVSGNVFLSYLSRSIWDPQISNLTSTATELLCWLLSVLLTALFHHPILNLSKYPLR